ncbi:MAG: peptidoglycan bridge formation glycyltransferase FemA/FemB family protein [Phoenicibacter congonensis]|uniref:Peptidoglycan bridge formation glycyltransferase FemA/FemB family protein n=1 Tax=Phoenicibacter congonensis TaxID=1944646 RepID=A0AA43U667_9ACTN|nr:peptidoglycan bridge formation glycyltransferase FemA/FemB family protein [Phoenicibacter congonensis]
MQRHFLQSDEWLSFQESQGNQTFSIKKENYEIYAVLKKTSMGNYIYCPYGPNLEDEEALAQAISDLKALAKQTNSFFVRVEPTLQIDAEKMKQLGFVKSFDLNPKATWVLDLDIDEKDLLKGIEKERTRYWRGREKRGMTIRVSKDPADVDILFEFLKACADENNWVGESKEYLIEELSQDFAMLYILELHKEADESSAENGEGECIPLAASLMFDDGETRFYGHSANSPEPAHRKLRANGVLLVQAILDAKAAGKKHFDFWGITLSEDKNHPWAGFTKFKKSFSGRPVIYTGTWDLPVNKVKFSTYQSLRKINRAFRRLLYH